LEGLFLPLLLDSDEWLLSRATDHFEGPQLEVRLDGGVSELPADQAFDVEHSVQLVLDALALGGVSDQTLFVGETHLRWRGAVALVVCYDFHVIVLHHSYARISCS